MASRARHAIPGHRPGPELPLTVREPALVVLVGASGSGKSTFARTHFRPTETVSSDVCRALVADDENALDANREAFRLLHSIASSRLRLRKVAVIDATNLQPGPRRSWITLAREHDVPVVAVVFDPPLTALEERATRRSDRHIPVDVIAEHHAQLHRSLPGIREEGFGEVHVLGSPEEIASFGVDREPASVLVREPRFFAEMALRWKRTWEQAWPRRDVEAIAALYAPSASYRALAFRDADGGLAGVRGYLQRNFDAESEVRCWFGEPVVEGRRAAVEWWACWVEDGRPLTLAGTTQLRFDDAGLAVDQRDYWNQVEECREPYPGW